MVFLHVISLPDTNGPQNGRTLLLSLRWPLLRLHPILYGNVPRLPPFLYKLWAAGSPSATRWPNAGIFAPVSCGHGARARSATAGSGNESR